jgi:hypothetical protein
VSVGAYAAPMTAGDQSDRRPILTNGVPATLGLAAMISALEALGVGGAGVWLIAQVVAEKPTGLGIAVSGAAFVLAGGGLLAVLAWALFRGKRWCRGPVAAVHLLLLPLGNELRSGETALAGIGLMVAAVAVLVLLFVRPSSTYFAAGQVAHDAD